MGHVKLCFILNVINAPDRIHKYKMYKPMWTVSILFVWLILHETLDGFVWLDLFDHRCNNAFANNLLQCKYNNGVGVWKKHWSLKHIKMDPEKTSDCFVYSSLISAHGFTVMLNSVCFFDSWLFSYNTKQMQWTSSTTGMA